MNPRLAALLLIIAVIILRIGSGFADPGLSSLISGFGPFSALVLGAALLLPNARLAWVPAAAFLLSDVILNLFVYNVSALHPFGIISAIFYAALFLLALPLSRRTSLNLPFLGATVFAVIAFHQIANTMSWLIEPAYAKSLAGFIQAQTTGLPGFPPSWVFLLKSLAGNLVFSILFLVALAPVRQPATSLAPARA